MAASRRYYESLVGSYRGAFSLSMTDSAAARSAPLSTRMAVRVNPWVGGFVMRTTLAATSEGFLHTTRVSCFGVTLFRTVETITLGADGRSLAMRGEQRSAVGPVEPYEANGEIDDTATRATYRVPWAGGALLQTTLIVAEGLELTQQSAWSRGFVRLLRQ